MITNPVDDANRVIFHHIARRYLFPGCPSVQTIDCACVMARRVANRSGILPDATTMYYEITHPDLKFVLTARAVWRCGALMAPLATHAIILDYEDLDDAHGSVDAVKEAVNDWMQGVPR